MNNPDRMTNAQLGRLKAGDSILSDGVTCEVVQPVHDGRYTGADGHSYGSSLDMLLRAPDGREFVICASFLNAVLPN